MENRTQRKHLTSNSYSREDMTEEEDEVEEGEKEGEEKVQASSPPQV